MQLAPRSRPTRACHRLPLGWSIVVDPTGSRSVSNRRGQALSEYAMLVAIVGMGLVVVLGLFGRATKHAWQKSESNFAEASPPASGGGGAVYGGGGSSSGGGSASGAVRHEPSTPPKKKSPADSTADSGSADSLGTSPDSQ